MSEQTHPNAHLWKNEKIWAGYRFRSRPHPKAVLQLEKVAYLLEGRSLGRLVSGSTLLMFSFLSTGDREKFFDQVGALGLTLETFGPTQYDIDHAQPIATLGLYSPDEMLAGIDDDFVNKVAALKAQEDDDEDEDEDEDDEEGGDEEDEDTEDFDLAGGDGFVSGWLDISRMMPYGALGIDPNLTSEAPDEVAASLVMGAGELLRAVTDKRPDEAGINDTIANFIQSADLGATVPGAEFTPEVLARLVFDQDSANRYARILMHALSIAMDYCPEGNTASMQAKDREDSYRNADGAEIADKAAEKLGTLVSPYGVMMLMMLAAMKTAAGKGMSPLQIINAVAKFSEVVLCTMMPVKPRIPEGAAIPGVEFTEEEVRTHKPNLAQAAHLASALRWRFAPSDRTAQTGLLPIFGLFRHRGGEIALLSAGFSPLSEEHFAVQARRATAYEFEMRNVDALLISTDPVAISRNGTVFTVVGEAFVKVDGSEVRSWRPLVVAPRCSDLGCVLELTRSPHFDLNDPEYADPNGEILGRLKK